MFAGPIGPQRLEPRRNMNADAQRTTQIFVGDAAYHTADMLNAHAADTRPCRPTPSTRDTTMFARQPGTQCGRCIKDEMDHRACGRVFQTIGSVPGGFSTQPFSQREVFPSKTKKGAKHFVGNLWVARMQGLPHGRYSHATISMREVFPRNRIRTGRGQ